MYVMFQASRLKSLNVVVVHDMAPKEAEARSNMDVGVFEARFNGWTLTFNWTQERKGKLWPDYIGVDYGDTSCGILGPHILRTCWHCGLTGWRDPAHKEPCVGSSYYDTGLWVACHCPKCYNLDWWARTIEPSRLLADCAAEIADKTKKAKLWKSFGGQEMDRNKSEESMKMAV